QIGQITIAVWAITYANDRETARRARREFNVALQPSRLPYILPYILQMFILQYIIPYVADMNRTRVAGVDGRDSTDYATATDNFDPLDVVKSS
ncbi:hypothetical protein L9F63_006876, partial [Diploptera punctata]